MQESIISMADEVPFKTKVEVLLKASGYRDVEEVHFDAFVLNAPYIFCRTWLTLHPEMKKAESIGRDLEEFSPENVQPLKKHEPESYLMKARQEEMLSNHLQQVMLALRHSLRKTYGSSSIQRMKLASHLMNSTPSLSVTPSRPVSAGKIRPKSANNNNINNVSRVKDSNSKESVHLRQSLPNSGTKKAFLLEPVLRRHEVLKAHNVHDHTDVSHCLHLLSSISAQNIFDRDARAVGILIGLLFQEGFRIETEELKLLETFAKIKAIAEENAKTPQQLAKMGDKERLYLASLVNPADHQRLLDLQEMRESTKKSAREGKGKGRKNRKKKRVQVNTRTCDTPSNPYVGHILVDPLPEDMTVARNIKRYKVRRVVETNLKTMSPKGRKFKAVISLKKPSVILEGDAESDTEAKDGENVEGGEAEEKEYWAAIEAENDMLRQEQEMKQERNKDEEESKKEGFEVAAEAAQNLQGGDADETGSDMYSDDPHQTKSKAASESEDEYASDFASEDPSSRATSRPSTAQGRLGDDGEMRSSKVNFAMEDRVTVEYDPRAASPHKGADQHKHHHYHHHHHHHGNNQQAKTRDEASRGRSASPKMSSTGSTTASEAERKKHFYYPCQRSSSPSEEETRKLLAASKKKLTLRDVVDYDEKRQGFGAFLMDKLVHKTRGAAGSRPTSADETRGRKKNKRGKSRKRDGSRKAGSRSSKASTEATDDDAAAIQDVLMAAAEGHTKHGHSHGHESPDPLKHFISPAIHPLSEHEMNLSMSVDVLGGEISDVIKKKSKLVIKKKRSTSKKRPKSAPSGTRSNKGGSMPEGEEGEEGEDVYTRLYKDAALVPTGINYMDENYLKTLGFKAAEIKHIFGQDGSSYREMRDKRTIKDTIGGKPVYIEYDWKTGRKLVMSKKEYTSRDKEWQDRNEIDKEDLDYFANHDDKAWLPTTPYTHIIGNYPRTPEHLTSPSKRAPAGNTGKRTDERLHRARKEVLVEKYSVVAGQQVNHTQNQTLAEYAVHKETGGPTKESLMKADHDHLKQQLEPLDLVIAIEHFHSCEELGRGGMLRQDEKEYLTMADSFFKDALLWAYQSNVIVRVGTIKFGSNLSLEKTAPPKNSGKSRVGAFEIYLLYKSRETSTKMSTIYTEQLHSKLTSKRWPSKSVVERRFKTFLGKANVPTYTHEIEETELKGYCYPSIEVVKGAEDPPHQRNEKRYAEIAKNIPNANHRAVNMHDYPKAAVMDANLIGLNIDTLTWNMVDFVTPESAAVWSSGDARERKRHMAVQWAYDCRSGEHLNIFREGDKVFVKNVHHPHGGQEHHTFEGDIISMEPWYESHHEQKHVDGREGDDIVNYELVKSLKIQFKYHSAPEEKPILSIHCIPAMSSQAPVVTKYSADAMPPVLSFVLYKAAQHRQKNGKSYWEKHAEDKSINKSLQLSRSSFFHQVRNLVWHIEQKYVNQREISHPHTDELLDCQLAYSEGVLNWMFGQKTAKGARYVDIVNMEELAIITEEKYKALYMQRKARQLLENDTHHYEHLGATEVHKHIPGTQPHHKKDHHHKTPPRDHRHKHKEEDSPAYTPATPATTASDGYGSEGFESASLVKKELHFPDIKDDEGHTEEKGGGDDFEESMTSEERAVAEAEEKEIADLMAQTNELLAAGDTLDESRKEELQEAASELHHLDDDLLEKLHHENELHHDHDKHKDGKNGKDGKDASVTEPVLKNAESQDGALSIATSHESSHATGATGATDKTHATDAARHDSTVLSATSAAEPHTDHDGFERKRHWVVDRKDPTTSTDKETVHVDTTNESLSPIEHAAVDGMLNALSLGNNADADVHLSTSNAALGVVEGGKDLSMSEMSNSKEIPIQRMDSHVTDSAASAAAISNYLNTAETNDTDSDDLDIDNFISESLKKSSSSPNLKDEMKKAKAKRAEKAEKKIEIIREGDAQNTFRSMSPSSSDDDEEEKKHTVVHKEHTHEHGHEHSHEVARGVPHASNLSEMKPNDPIIHCASHTAEIVGLLMDLGQEDDSDDDDYGDDDFHDSDDEDI